MDQMDLFSWADSRPRAKVIGITKFILQRYVPGLTLKPRPAELIDFAEVRAEKSSTIRATETKRPRGHRL